MASERRRAALGGRRPGPVGRSRWPGLAGTRADREGWRGSPPTLTGASTTTRTPTSPPTCTARRRGLGPAVAVRGVAGARRRRPHPLRQRAQLWTLPFRLARYGFSSDRSGKAYSIARAEGRTPAELVRDFDDRDPWAGTCRVFPPGSRCSTASCTTRTSAAPSATTAHDPRGAAGRRPRATPALGSVFGAKRRTKGLRFEATDVDWSWGDGPEVPGPARRCSWRCSAVRRARRLDGPGLPGLDGLVALVA